MRPIDCFRGSPTYKLSKYLTNVLKPLTDESRRRHKLQSTENFIGAIKTIYRYLTTENLCLLM